MKSKILISLNFMAVIALAACAAIPVNRLTAGTSMVTSGGSTGQWQEIPMSAIQLKDKVFMVTYVRWEPADESAGTHNAKWLWYRDGQVVHTCESKGIELNKTPFRLWCGTQAAGLGVGHFRVELSIDGVPFATNEFDVVDVSGEGQETTARYEAGPGDEVKAVGSSAIRKGVLLSHCANAIQVARDIGFPSEAEDAGLREGSVTVSVVLTPTGSIKNIKIVSSTDKSFNQAAIEAATRLRCSGGDLRQETEIQWKIAYESTQPAPLPPHDAKAAIDPRKCVKPAYPAGSLRPGEQRVVKMKFHVNANGDAVGGEVVRSSGSRRLDQAAIDALIVCRFKPALEDGKPVEGYAEIDYIWKLE